MRDGAALIRHQIKEREEHALLEEERQDQENQQFWKAHQARLEEDKAAKQQKQMAQHQLMAETLQANQESIARRRTEKLSEQEEDRRIMQYLVEKERKNVEADRAALAKKAERDVELARMRAKQERLTDKQAAQDALRARRAYEDAEREWRRKEKETAEKHAQLEKQLRQDRWTQQQAKDRALAQEAEKLRAEFYENLERAKQEEARVAALSAQQKQASQASAAELKKQIELKAAERMREREAFFMEGVLHAAEQAEQQRKINAIRDAKLRQLKELGIPDHYCTEIERKIKQLGRRSLTQN
ncbi:hypothetical protein CAUPRSCDRAFT_12465 [Caulochytrium protostelioides]|nr:hypothetical protein CAUPRSCDRAFT_12465 [Caulochytrium protostelioides]